MKKQIVAVLILILILALAVGCQKIPIPVPGADPSTTDAGDPQAPEVTAAINPTEVTEAVDVPEVTQAGAVQEGFLPGKKAYDFELKTRDGVAMKLSDHLGKTVVINFFASWCPPCQAEMPHFNEVYLDLKDKDVVIIGVNLTEQDDLEDLEALLKEHNIAFPILMDEKSEVANRYAIRSIPVSVIVQPDGIVSEYHVGLIDKDRLIGLIEKAQSTEE